MVPWSASFYGIELTSQLGMSASAPMVNFKLRSEVVLDVRQLNSDTFQFAFVLPKAEFEKTHTEAQAQLESLSKELQQPS